MTDQKALRVSRILHAGYVFECDDIQIAFDPIFETPFSRNCYPFPNVQFDLDMIRKLRFAAVFISHYHDDHCSFESLNFLDRKTPIYIYCVHPEMAAMIRDLGFESVHQLQIDQPVLIDSFKVIPRRALDADVDSIFQIKAAGLNVLNVVDSWIDPETLQQLSQEAPWDLVLWPFQTMRELEVLSPGRSEASTEEIPPEWPPQLKELNPRFLVPSSCQFIQENWSWYNHALFPISYRGFQKQIQSILPQSQVVRLDPGISFFLKQSLLMKAPSLEWVHPIGPQDVDYDYRADLVPPKTSEVAKKFPALSQKQAQRVFEYSRSGLLEKFKSLEVSGDSYFQKLRRWQLRIYDHLGQATSFDYHLRRSKIEQVFESAEPLGWFTEIPLYKFHAALEEGESLTSMYARINDCVFNSETEMEIQSVDLVEDPLVRCLFNDEFGAYQKAQLKRLTQ